MIMSEYKKAFLKQEVPILRDIIALKPVVWINPNRNKMAEMPPLHLNKRDMESASRLWERFAPYLAKVFPETESSGGVLESPLKEIVNMKLEMEKRDGDYDGRLFLKCDNSLPVVGSIKARGGFYEVMHLAEDLAIKNGLINKEDNHEKFATKKFKDFFSKYHIGVGSTGNLGLSIGTISAQLGFKVTVYMSSDARQWKKDLLRKRGATVVEFGGDFSEAILIGRQRTLSDPMGYFVDDENSHELFIGYSVGPMRLKKQLEAQGVIIDEDHQLFVYSPCGVGGSPGGTAFGLKQIYGDNVHCFFVEPTHSPAVLVGLTTGEMSNISVQDIGIDNKTEADGLAVGRASHFATNISAQMISGIYTIEDNELYRLLKLLKDSEGIFLEPSATAGLIGPQIIATTNYAEKNGIDMKNAIHIAWATGGDLVPDYERDIFYEKGMELSK